ncbi:porin family protein [Paucihalobacter sp.]|uniref:porin family protein n=1 Tax=Paucihalobacter sp. TaxID=2850405 RepID=UPI002FE0990E
MNIRNPRHSCLVVFISFFSLLNAQVEIDSLDLDDKYREDQFYLSVTYNFLSNKPENVTQKGFPTGLHLGFIRDMPVNERRNLSVGLGLGISSNSYNQNILINSNIGPDNFDLIDGETISFTKNKFTTYLVEVPFELRWRTSTSSSYKFWRVYTGVKVGYVLFNSSKYEGNLGDIKNKNIENFEKLQYGLTLSFGYSTFNFHVYYSLNNIFKDTSLNGESIDLSALKIGLITYIL